MAAMAEPIRLLSAAPKRTLAIFNRISDSGHSPDPPHRVATSIKRSQLAA